MGWSVIVVLFVVLGVVLIGRWWMHQVGPDIAQTQFQERIKQSDYLLLDVRSPGEYAGGYIPGARNIPHSTLSNHLNELEVYKDKDVIVYCQHGPRSRLAQRSLLRAGFSNVFHLQGDMSKWKSQDLPLETPPAE